MFFFVFFIVLPPLFSSVANVLLEVFAAVRLMAVMVLARMAVVVVERIAVMVLARMFVMVVERIAVM